MADMVGGIRCSNCGTQIVGEPPAGDPAQRQPCPRCESVARTSEVTASGGATAGGSAAAVFITYPEALLTAAGNLLAAGEFSIAVVVAHMACEISAERALSRAFKAKALDHLEESVGDLLPGYNLANDRVRNLYNAATGDQIQNRHFWQAFKESAARRNQAVHRGRIITKQEADASLRAASDLVASLR